MRKFILTMMLSIGMITTSQAQAFLEVKKGMVHEYKSFNHKNITSYDSKDTVKNTIYYSLSSCRDIVITDDNNITVTVFFVIEEENRTTYHTITKYPKANWLLLRERLTGLKP